MEYKTKKTISIVLGIASAIGTVVTAILVAKETPKAMEKIKKLKKENDKPKPIDYVKTLAPVYWPAATVCLGTVASTTVSQIMSVKAQASLIATSSLLSEGWRRYKGKVKDIFGIESEKNVTNDISKEEYEENKDKFNNIKERLYYEEHLGFFTCSERNLLTSITDLNQRLHTPDPSPEGTFYWTTLYFLIKDSKAKVFDKSKLKACKNIGWTTDYLCDVYDLNCMWVHVYFTNVIKKETGELLYTKIDFWEEPIFLTDSETSRYHYKSRADYEHDAECDMHDYDAYRLYANAHEEIYGDCDGNLHSMIQSKIDCDPVNDNGRRYQPSNLENTTSVACIEDDSTLPRDIPEI